MPKLQKYGWSRLVTLVFSACTLSNQLQAAGAPAQVRALHACGHVLMKTAHYLAQEICCCLRAQDSAKVTC